jgi:hypothetical protein
MAQLHPAGRGDLPQLYQLYFLLMPRRTSLWSAPFLYRMVENGREKEVDNATKKVYNTDVDNATNIFQEEGYAG